MRKTIVIEGGIILIIDNKNEDKNMFNKNVNYASLFLRSSISLVIIMGPTTASITSHQRDKRSVENVMKVLKHQKWVSRKGKNIKCNFKTLKKILSRPYYLLTLFSHF